MSEESFDQMLLVCSEGRPVSKTKIRTYKIYKEYRKIEITKKKKSTNFPI